MAATIASTFFAEAPMVLMSPMVYVRLSVSRMESKTRRSALFLKSALVGVAYYVGALVGFALKFPSHDQGARTGPGVGDQSQYHRGTWRTAVGDSQCAPRRHLSVHAAGDRKHGVVMLHT
jgi:hypothetical protein